MKEFERKQGRVVKLPPGGKHTAMLEIAVHSTEPAVQAVEQEIGAMQRGREAKVHSQPQVEWSPG